MSTRSEKMRIYRQNWKKKNPKKYKEKQRKYQCSEKGRKVQRKYKCSERGRKTSRDWIRQDYAKDSEKYRVRQIERRRSNPEKMRIRNLINRHPERYPLDDKCAFCPKTENLERGHLDYEDNGFNYLTVCSACNKWMDKPIGEHEHP